MSHTDEAVPVTILTGFLGVGKTTLLRRVLADPKGIRFGVLINDFGAVNIDTSLVVESTADQVSLENGCVCCTIRSDLAEAIEKLLDIDPRPDRLIIEASGVSRPLPIADTLDSELLSGRVALDGIFCLVDGAGFVALDFAEAELALEQATGADLVIINKTDTATPEQLEGIEQTLRGAMPKIRLVRASHGDVSHTLLFGTGAGKQDDREAGQVESSCGGTHDHGHGHDHAHEVESHSHDHADWFESWHWEHPGAVDAARLRKAIRDLPPGLLRAKGILRAADGAPGRLVFHLVGKRTELAREPDEAPSRSAVVAIGRRGSFDPEALSRVFTDCLAD